MASASTYDGLLLKDDLREWAKVPGVEVHYSLSKPTDQVDAHIGYINDLLPGLGLDLLCKQEHLLLRDVFQNSHNDPPSGRAFA